jgi:hypothetical protein
MDLLMEEINSNPTSWDSIKFGDMARRLVANLEALPLDQEWTHVFLKGLNIDVHNGQMSRETQSFLWYVDHQNTADVCDHMWMYTKSSRYFEAGYIFDTIRRCRKIPNMHADSLKTLTVLETLCNEFNSCLGRRCEELSALQLKTLNADCVSYRMNQNSMEHDLLNKDRQLTKIRAELVKTHAQLAEALKEVDQLKRRLIQHEETNWRPNGHLRALLRQLSPQTSGSFASSV